MKFHRADLEKIVQKEEKPQPQSPGMVYFVSVAKGNLAEFAYILRRLVHLRIDYDTFENADGSIDVFIRENRTKEIHNIFSDTKQKVSGVYPLISI